MRQVAEDCLAWSQHSRWLRHWSKESASTEKAPKPGYRDCENCPLRRQAIDEQDRRGICESCPWLRDSETGRLYPDCPGERYLFAQEMAMYPDYLLASYADELTLEEHKAISMIRQSQETERMANLMGASWLQ